MLLTANRLAVYEARTQWCAAAIVRQQNADEKIPCDLWQDIQCRNDLRQVRVQVRTPPPGHYTGLLLSAAWIEIQTNLAVAYAV
eukprot:SAG31_NODE_86_length_26973_cov_16.850897_23_plen_84_part_00